MALQIAWLLTMGGALGVLVLCVIGRKALRDSAERRGTRRRRLLRLPLAVIPSDVTAMRQEGQSESG